MADSKIRVADYIARRCVEAGAKHVFIVTGGGAMHLNDAFNRNQHLQTYCFHHEQAAAIAAESYFRINQTPAVLNVTTGPGGINALNGVFGAYVDSCAMFVISGQVKRETYAGNFPDALRQLGDQEVRIVDMVRPVVKYATVLNDPMKVKAVMDKAVYLAVNGRPGPVWVDVPVDVQGSLINENELVGWDQTQKMDLINDPDITDNTKQELIQLGRQDVGSCVDEIVSRLKTSKRPVLFVGTGVRLSGMHELFLELIEKLQIPVVTGWNAHDSIGDDCKFYAGRPGTVGDRPGNFAVQNADFVLILGARLNIRQISYNWKEFAPLAWKAMVDVDLAELNKPTLNIDCAVHSDLKEFLPLLKDKVAEYAIIPAHQEYLRWCKTRRDLYPVVLPSFSENLDTLNPYVFIESLFDELTSEDIVIAANGSACVIGFQAAKIKIGQRFFTNSGNASMGYDIPAAIGAFIASGAKRVICLAGDGSAMMNIQELQTIVGYKLPIKVLILNNNGYQSIKQTQTAYFPDNVFGTESTNGVSFPEFTDLARAFAIPAVKVKTLQEWSSAQVQEILNSSGPGLIDVVVDEKQGFAPKLTSRKADDGTMISPRLEDMSPFLSREELASNMIGFSQSE
jgi:acetolactate synthase-1/2/3 large subunit